MRRWIAALLLTALLLIVSCGNEAGQNFNSVEVMTDNAWQAGPDLPEGLHGVPALVVDGRLYVLGGSRRAGDVDNAGEVWSIDLDDL